MKKYVVEVDEAMEKLLVQNAKTQNLSVEKFVAQILNRYVVDPHILDSEDVKKAYSDCGDVNLDWANL